MKQEINIVWLKRDIRSQDHLPLHLAEQSNLPYIIIYLFEPSIINYPDTSLRHLQFQYFSLKNLNEKLFAYNKFIEVIYTEVLRALDYIRSKFEIKNIFSYQESGIQLTYDRDKAVAVYCKIYSITWTECQRDGVIRGIKNRQGWDKQWFVTMHSPITKNEFSKKDKIELNHPYNLQKELQQKLEDYPKDFQPAGEDYAWKYLKSFVAERGKNYSKHISKPAPSRLSCSRLSPYLAWGNLSIKQAYQHIQQTRSNTNFKTALGNSLTRLKWHCHFIQKFEVECSYENYCINAGYELLEHVKNEEHINAWKQGCTGFPLVDALMICLHKTGWINFRMRAMLVSFFCHQLLQNWKDATYHLANLFLDYEPGIHYPQFQMQAGTTGINTIRMYNPIKQSYEHDADGEFIKKWLPQLQNVPTQFIHEPYKMTLIEQQLCGVIIGEHYPAPIVNIEENSRIAKAKIWGHRKNDLVKQENKRILFTHTRRKKENDNFSKS